MKQEKKEDNNYLESSYNKDKQYTDNNSLLEKIRVKFSSLKLGSSFQRYLINGYLVNGSLFRNRMYNNVAK